MSSWLKILSLFLLFLFGCFLSYLFELSYLESVIAVYFPATTLNLFWLGKTRGKILIFVAVTTVLFALPIEILSRLANSWEVQSIPFRIFGIAPVENLLYAFFNFIWVLAFYEHFINHEKKKRFSRRLIYLAAIYLALFTSVMAVFWCCGETLGGLDYWVIGLLVLFFPALLIYGRNPRLLLKTIVPTAFFALVFFVHEVISLKLGYWWWPGDYLWTFHIWGEMMPLDDVIIWYLISTPTLIGGYEFFADDYR